MMTTPSPLTDDELAAIEARWNKTGTFPWEYNLERGEVEAILRNHDGSRKSYIKVAFCMSPDRGKFIASIHQDAPRLLATIEHLRKAALDWLDSYTEAQRIVIGESSAAPFQDIAAFEAEMAERRGALEALK